MDQTTTSIPRTTNPRRKKRSPLKRILRVWLPPLLILALIVLFIVFAVGSVRRGNEAREAARQESIAAEESMQQILREQEAEAAKLLAEAELLAQGCNYNEAIAVLESFSGDINDYESMVNARQTYAALDSQLVAWEDVTKIPCLCFGTLIGDGNEYFAATGIGSSNQYYYITTLEFSLILQQLYDNGYMLVSWSDLFTTGTQDNGSSGVSANTLRLPAGKKPLLMMQVQVDGDVQLVLGQDGKYATVLKEGGDPTFASAYDFLPILEEFIQVHPGFSFRGARAILAINGKNGIFGYGTDQTSTVTALVDALREDGYTIACNTYGNAAYGKLSLLELQDDLSNWQASVEPILGKTELLVYAKSSDISDTKEHYSGKKYETLLDAGFRYYFGLCYNASPWMNISSDSIRIGRLMVTGNNLEKNPALFANMFDAKSLLDSGRK